MNYMLLFSALRARFRVFLLIVGVTVLAAAAASLLLPKTYVAKVSLLLDGRDEQSLSTTTRIAERERTGYMQTQVDIITSPKVAERVVRDLDLADSPDALTKLGAADYDPTGTASVEEWIADRLLKRLKVETSSSSVAQLNFAAADPEIAAQVANAFARAYVNTVLDLRVEPARQASAWFVEQLKGLRDNLEEAEQKLAAFRQEHGMSALEAERLDADTLRMADFAALATRDRNAGGRPSMGEILNTPSMLALRAEVQRAEARLREMSAEYGINHPQYQRQQAQVASLRAALSGETRYAVTGVEVARGRTPEEIKAAVERQRARALEIAKARSHMAVLTHDAAIAQRTYDEAMQRYLASNVNSRAVQTNVSVLDQATPPGKPARPKLWLNIGIALVVGTLIGLAAVHLLEMFDHRVRLIEDLADPHVPLLAVLDKWNPVADRLAGPDVRRALPGPG